MANSGESKNVHEVPDLDCTGRLTGPELSADGLSAWAACCMIGDRNDGDCWAMNICGNNWRASGNRSEMGPREIHTSEGT